MGFPTKNDHFGVFWGYHHFWKHPYQPNLAPWENWKHPPAIPEDVHHGNISTPQGARDPNVLRDAFVLSWDSENATKNHLSMIFFWMFDVVKMEGCFLYKASFYVSVVIRFFLRCLFHLLCVNGCKPSILLKIYIHQSVGGGSMLVFFQDL